jgi:phage-related protein
MRSGPDRYEIELEPEVRNWLDALPVRHYIRVMQVADDLADAAETFGEPRSRHLGGPVRELRMHLEPDDWRVTYWLAPGRRVVLLTAFRKTRMRESAQVDRALAAQAECARSHDVGHDLYDRPLKPLEES